MAKETRPALGRYHGSRIIVEGFISIVQPSKIGRGWRACLRHPAYQGEVLADHVWLVLKDHPGEYRKAVVSGVVARYEIKEHRSHCKGKQGHLTYRFGLDRPEIVG